MRNGGRPAGQSAGWLAGLGNRYLSQARLLKESGLAACPLRRFHFATGASPAASPPLPDRLLLLAASSAAAKATLAGTPAATKVTQPAAGGCEFFGNQDTIDDSLDIQIIDSPIIELSTLRAATTNFDEGNKLGEGAFGVVFKGILPHDQEIVVKRFTQSSGQGFKKFKNELALVPKLKHMNLVRLVGVCLEDHEKLLVYEFMPKRSLDTILFDHGKRSEIDWGKRFKILNGIAQGLQYLHEDSPVKIIHRNLNPSHVLLDSDYNPKISGFGLARLFEGDQTQDAFATLVGTLGYIAPEYALRGYCSIKSDVFSFGVMILEIVIGRRNRSIYFSEETPDLVTLVWEHWTTGTLIEIIDSSLSNLSSLDQMLKCIHIGLLCVQDNPMDRPMMSTVNIMLNSNTMTLETPSKPVFCIPKGATNSYLNSDVNQAASQSPSGSPMSQIEDLVSELEPR